MLSISSSPQSSMIQKSAGSKICRQNCQPKEKEWQVCIKNTFLHAIDSEKMTLNRSSSAPSLLSSSDCSTLSPRSKTSESATDAPDIFDDLSECLTDDSEMDNCMEDDSLWIIRYSRCPREFDTTLLSSSELQDCRYELSSGTKCFCSLNQFAYIEKSVSVGQAEVAKLRGRDVICSAEWKEVVKRIVAELPGKLKVKMVSERELPPEML